ncbi:hypothetical protein [Klebsiella aerogenes]|uniref:hypothetical protein n=1 Tax=Klebsiella aerogenes TaxID=548 RepID=UPI001F5B54CF|nr:hypothetical protein [Klebsiella aerogenes]
MKYQVARLYRNGEFVGYGIAVAGILLEGQVSTTIETEPGELPKVTATFNLLNEHLENQPKIDLDNPRASKELQFVIHPDRTLTIAQAEELRDVVNGFLTRNKLSDGVEWKS